MMPKARNITESVGWTDEESKELLRKALEVVKPGKPIYYKNEIKKLNFFEISQNFKHHSPDDCEKKLLSLIEQIVKTKSLSQILKETLDNYDSSNTGRTFMSKFMKTNNVAIESAAKRENKSKLHIANQMWSKLSINEKRQFTKSSRRKHENDTALSPFECYLRRMKMKKGEVDYKECRMKYTLIQMKKKLRYIKKSIETLRKEKEENDKFISENPTAEKPEVSKHKYPNKEEMKYYLEYLEIPPSPAKSIYVFSFKERCLDTNEMGSNILMASLKAFKELSEKQRRKCLKHYHRAWEDYKKKFALWKANQDEFIINLIAVEGKPKRKRRTTRKLKEIEMPLTKVKFPDEPKVPPLTALSLFANKLEKSEGRKFDKVTLRKKFDEKDEDFREMLAERATEMQSSFAVMLKEFVAQMPDDRRKLYLGLRRKKLMSLLKMDIFKEDYPDDVYPVYITMKEKKKPDSQDESFDLEDGIDIDDCPKQKLMKKRKSDVSESDFSPGNSKKLKIGDSSPNTILKRKSQGTSGKFYDPKSSESEAPSKSSFSDASTKKLKKTVDYKVDGELSEEEKVSLPKASSSKTSSHITYRSPKKVVTPLIVTNLNKDSDSDVSTVGSSSEEEIAEIWTKGAVKR